MGKSNIAWTDYVWNPVTGCTKVSTGCKNCYAARMAVRLAGMNSYGWMNGRTFDQVKEHPEKLEEPLFWKKPRRIFVDSMGDLFHEKVSDEAILRVFGIMEECSHKARPVVPAQSVPGGDDFAGSRAGSHEPALEALRCHQFLILTKRPERMAKMSLEMRIPENVWLGTSIEDQVSSDERLAWLMEIDHPNLFVSTEPLLGPIKLPRKFYLSTWLKWLIIGGESGPGARPCDPEWVKELIYQAAAAGVRVFFKQWGMWIHRSQLPHNFAFTEKDFPPEYEYLRTTKEKAGNMIDGVVREEYPEGLQMNDAGCPPSHPDLRSECSQGLRSSAHADELEGGA